MPRRFLVAGLMAILSSFVMAANVAPVLGAPATRAISITMPRSAQPGHPFVVTVRLPAGVAAVDGRVLARRGTLDMWGVAPVGRGLALRPERIAGGFAFGAYDLRGQDGETVLRLVMEAKRAGRLQVRVVIDSMADQTGRRLALSGTDRLATVGVAGGTTVLAAPASAWDAAPRAAAVPARDLLPDGRIDKQDVDATRIGWTTARMQGHVCGVAEGDANGDGCVDIVDLQAARAARGTRVSMAVPASGPVTMAPPGSYTYVVNSTADTPDALPGDGICADTLGRCTLRAAMTDSGYITGNDRVEFNIVGVAPVTIQLTSRLPNIGSRNGTLTIDGYTQPGSHVNTSTVGSNATMGIEIRGNGNSAGEIGLYISSAGNVVRGVSLNNIRRAVLIDGADAHDNRFIGNWVGFNKDGSLPTRLQYGVLLNFNAHDNRIGTPDLADRNLIGNYGTGIDHYGTGVAGNRIQNNAICLRPTGLLVGTCNTAIDYNFGPKNNVIGGSGANERNVIGPTFLQGIEWSHGWNPEGVHGATDDTWSVSGNSAIGNWVGFRGDGSYSSTFRSGLNASSADNANGINAYDGARNNLIEGNFVASVYDGIIVMSGNAEGNIVRNNTVGVSPLGQAAPLTRWGIIVRLNTRDNIVQGNTIRNATSGGIGLLDRINSGALAAVADRIRISRNIVTDTNGPAIYLAPDPNLPGSTANHGIQRPVFTSATSALVRGTAIANGTVELFRASRPLGQAGLPTEFLAAGTVGPDGTWSIPVSLAVGDRITALQIAPNNDTSELALNVAVVAGPPPPQSGDLLASDDFGRTVANGWGTAVQGGTWSLIGSAADFSVGNGVGQMRTATGVSREARLNLAVADVDLAGRVSFDRLPATGNAFAYVEARVNGNTMYRVTVRVATTGAVFAKLTRVVNNAQSDVATEVNTGVTTVAGGQIGFRFRLVGGHLQFRAWDAAAAEPAAWSTEANDATPELVAAGAIGLKGYTATGVPNGPIFIAFDNIDARVP